MEYKQHVGLIQGGLFYKQITNTLITSPYTATTGDFAGDLVLQWLNVGNSRLYGLEVSYQQRLSMLPGGLGGFGMFGNYSWTGSRVNSIPGRTDSPAMQRQAPNSWNFSPTYDRGPFSIRLGLSYNGSTAFVNQREYYKPTIAAGLRYTFNHRGKRAISVPLWFNPFHFSIR